MSASFRSDGERIVTASYDYTARVWDLDGKLVAELQGYVRTGTNHYSFAFTYDCIAASRDTGPAIVSVGEYNEEEHMRNNFLGSRMF